MKSSKFRVQNLLGIIILVGFFLFLIPNQTQAALVPCGGETQPACQFCHIFVLLNNIFVFLLIPNADINNNFPLVPTIAGLMLIIGGFYLLTAGANPSTLGKAKSVITATIIGMVIIFIAWIFLNTLLDFMGIQVWTGLGNWWEFTDKCPIR